MKGSGETLDNTIVTSLQRYRFGGGLSDSLGRYIQGGTITGLNNDTLIAIRYWDEILEPTLRLCLLRWILGSSWCTRMSSLI